MTDMYIECPYCKKRLTYISGSHLKKHNKSKDDIKKEFNNMNLMSPGLLKKREILNIEKYGVKNISQLKEVKEKKENTSIKKYGTKHSLQSEIVKNKIKRTCLEKFGHEYMLSNKEIRVRITDSKMKKFLPKMKKILDELNLEFLDEQYLFAHHVHNYKCKNCGFLFKRNWNEIQQYGFRCPICNPRNWSCIPNELLTNYKEYRKRVNTITERSIKEKFTSEELVKRGRAGVDGAYHIDHIFSITEGFLHNIPFYIIGHSCNLRLIPWLENNKKHSKCDISMNELYRLVESSENK